MPALRAFLKGHLFTATGLIALALVMRVLVPSGFMPMTEQASIVVGLCSSSGPATMAIEITKDVGDASHDGKADAPCAFAGLGSPALAGGADPVLLALAIAFAMLLVARAVVPLAPPPVRLRPPLRGPPLTA